MSCEWCHSEKVTNVTNTVYWELPDGTRAITIKDTPSVRCDNCEMTYQKEEMIEKIETQLLLINTSLLPDTLTYDELMAAPRILKRNYFDFES